MTARAALLTTLLLATAHAQTTSSCTLPTDLPSRTRTIVMLDITTSMFGRSGSPGSFPALKAQLTRMLQTQRGELRLITFDAGVRSDHTYRLPQDRARALQDLNAARPHSSSTWLYRSLEASFVGLKQDPQVATTVYLLTDGQDNDPVRMYTAQRALDTFQRVRGPLDHIYYLALGTTIPTDTRAALNAGALGSATELPTGTVPNLSGGPFPPALLTLPNSAAPTVRLQGVRTAHLDPRRAGRDLSVTVADHGRLHLNVTRDVPPGAATLLCATTPYGDRRVLLRFPEGLSGPPNSAAAPLKPLGVRPDGRTLTLLPVAPGARTALPYGGSTTLRYRLHGTSGASRVRLVNLPTGMTGELRGVNADGELPSGSELSIHLRNVGLTRAAVVTPALLVGDVQVPLPAIRASSGPSTTPARAGAPARTSASFSPWLLLIVVGAAVGAFLNRHRLVIPPPRRPAPPRPPAPPPPPTRTAIPHPDGASAAFIAPVPPGFGRPVALSLAEGTLTIRGEGLAHETPLPHGEHDLGITLALPALLGVRIRRAEAGTTLEALPYGVTLLHGSVVLNAGEALPVSAPLALSGLSDPSDRAGLPYRLSRAGADLPLRADAVRPVPPAAMAVDLGEASGITALSGLTILSDGGAYYLSRLPGGVRVSAGGEALKLGTALVPVGTYVVDGPALPEPLQLTWTAPTDAAPTDTPPVG